MKLIKKSFIALILFVAYMAVTLQPTHAHSIHRESSHPLVHNTSYPIPIDPDFNKDLLQDVEKIVIASRTSINILLLNPVFVQPDGFFDHDKLHRRVKQNLSHLSIPVQTLNESGLKIFSPNDDKVLFVILDISFEKIESAPTTEMLAGAITPHFWRMPTAPDSGFSGYYSKAIKSLPTIMFVNNQHSFDQAIDRSITHISYWLTPRPSKTNLTPKD